MKLFLGTANTGKSERILSRIAEVMAEKKGTPFLITPSTNAAEVFLKRLEAICAGKTAKGSLPNSISFPALFEKILRLSGETARVLTTFERYKLLRLAIAKLANENRLVYFDKTADKPGVINSLAKFINELWRANIDAKEFAKLTENRSKKDTDVALIFQSYESALKNAKAFDAEGAGLFALRFLKSINQGEKNFSDAWKAKLKSSFPFLAADGFDFYTPVQVKILSLLSHMGVETSATLTFSEARAVHLWQEQTFRRFKEENAEVIHCPNSLPSEISQLADAFMSDAKQTGSDNAVGKTTREISENPGAENLDIGEKKSPVKIISAPERASEVRAVARAIKRLVLEENFDLEDITIVCRSLNAYEHYFERVFEESLIPLELDNQLALAENPFIIAFLNLLKLQLHHFPRRAVVESLRSPYFNYSEFGLDEKNIDLLEAISLDEKITRTKNQWLDALEHPTTKRKFDDEKEIEAIQQEPKSALATKLRNFFEAVSFEKPMQRKGFVQGIRHLLALLKIDEQMVFVDEGSQEERQKAKGYKSDESENQIAAYHAFLELLELLSKEDDADAIGNRLLGDDSLNDFEKQKRHSWADIFIELERAVAATTFRRAKMKHSSIVVQEAHNLRPRNYRAIFIVGLIEGEFPKKSAETTPYTVAEKNDFRKLGIDFAETINDAGADLTQFHKAMTRASERLFLSYGRTDFAGGELLKSYLIDEVKAITQPVEIRLAQIEKDSENSVSQEAISLEELALQAAKHLPQLGKSHFDKRQSGATSVFLLLESRLKSWPTTLRAALVEHGRLTGKERAVFGGQIVDEKLAAKIRERFAEDYSWSATRLNDFGLCPFRFFAKNVLNLVPLEEPSEGFGAEGLGSAYHEILEKTFSDFAAQKMQLNEATIEQAIATAERITEDILQKLLDDRKIRKSSLWDFEKNEIKKRLVNLLRSEVLANAAQPVTSVAFEQSFGFKNQPPLVIEDAEGKIKIRGTIDRIDKNDKGLVVIDYKTSRSPISPKEALHGRNLQLPIYLMAANGLKKFEDEVQSGYFLHIYSCKKGSEFPNKQATVAEITQTAENFIREYVNKARRAEFPVQPNQNRCPAFCNYDVMCRIQSLNTSTGED
jgi:ATP-dependent helicase/DNAse subunit B